MRVFLSLLFLIPSFSSSAQFLREHHLPLEGNHYLNPRFADSTGVRTVRLSFQLKPDGRPVRETGVRKTFYFDEGGNVIRVLDEVSHGLYVDSLYTETGYDNGRITRIRSHDAFGYYILLYDHDSTGREISEKLYRISPSGREYEIGGEHYRYEVYPGQVKKITVNSEGRPYKEEISYYEAGKLTGRFEKSQVGGVQSDESWTYSPEGRIAAYRKQGSSGPGQQYMFVYDDSGRLSGWEIFTGEDKIAVAEVLWREGQSWPTAFIIRNEEKKEITIIRIEAF